MRVFMMVVVLMFLLLKGGCPSACLGGEPGNSMRWEQLFGDQKLHDQVALVRDERIQDYDITVKVVSGEKLRLLGSANPIVTLVDGYIKAKTDDVIDPARMYVYGTIKLRNPFGERVYTCSVRITSGMFAGAVIHLREGLVPDSIVDIYQAYYPLPTGTVVMEGDLTFELVSFVSK